jgi:hypothetical protein
MARLAIGAGAVQALNARRTSHPALLRAHGVDPHPAEAYMARYRDRLFAELAIELTNRTGHPCRSRADLGAMRRDTAHFQLAPARKRKAPLVTLDARLAQYAGLRDASVALNSFKRPTCLRASAASPSRAASIARASTRTDSACGKRFQASGDTAGCSVF